MASDPQLFIDDFRNLIDCCIRFYDQNKNRVDLEYVHKNRSELSAFVEAFHKDCGTLTSAVEKRIEDLKNGVGLVLMTAHQPNFLAYSGVFRKATLSFVLARKLEEILGVPVVNLFGIADQDFTDDRWVKSAHLPDVERKGGVLELHFSLPEKLILKNVARPSRQTLSKWQNEIENWFTSKLSSIERSCKSFGIEFNRKDNEVTRNFEAFWGIVENAYTRAKTFSDFNAFVISNIVNRAWGYDTLFYRFSESQQIFGREFCFLLSHFNEYSRYVKEATISLGTPEGGVYLLEYNTLPFWYHCDCGSKARLMAEWQEGILVGRGECLLCGKEYQIPIGSKEEPKISGILSRISARSLAMPLVFFAGLDVSCYVGGVGGREYLHQAMYVAKNMGMTFPPITVWRPIDVYFGVGQLQALMAFRKLSGTFDLSQYSTVLAKLNDKLVSVQKEIDGFELQKRNFAKEGAGKEEIIERIKALSVEQDQTRKQAGFSSLARNLGLLNNVMVVMGLHSSIADYALNVGLEATSKQWMTFLRENGSLSSNLRLSTDFDGFVKNLGFSDIPQISVYGAR